MKRCGKELHEMVTELSRMRRHLQLLYSDRERHMTITYSLILHLPVPTTRLLSIQYKHYRNKGTCYTDDEVALTVCF